MKNPWAWIKAFSKGKENTHEAPNIESPNAIERAAAVLFNLAMVSNSLSSMHRLVAHGAKIDKKPKRAKIHSESAKLYATGDSDARAIAARLVELADGKVHRAETVALGFLLGCEAIEADSQRTLAMWMPYSRKGLAHLDATSNGDRSEGKQSKLEGETRSYFLAVCTTLKAKHKDWTPNAITDHAMTATKIKFNAPFPVKRTRAVEIAKAEALK